MAEEDTPKEPVTREESNEKPDESPKEEINKSSEEKTSKQGPEKKSEEGPKEKIILRPIDTEMKKSYLDYSMSVIVGRALPDVRDGLKPVHRRVLFTMHEVGLAHNKPFRKSANVVGNCMARYHPHGDMAIYDTLVRMAQDFSLRYPLVDGQGNFGCFTKDTKIALTDGRNLSFDELIKESKKDKKNYTYTINEKRDIDIAEIKNPRLTKKTQRILKIVLDNDNEIKCTLNHKFMLRDGIYKEAKELKSGDSLMPLKLNHKVRDTIFLNESQDVYDLTIDNTHNFALASGVFVHNSVDGDSAAASRYCITGDSLILTNRGILPVGTISTKKEANLKMEILSYNGKKNLASKFFNSGKHNIIEVKTALGYKIKGSYNHPLMCWNIKDGIPGIQWKLLKDISEKDIVILNRNTSLFSKSDLDLRKYFPKLRNRAKKFDLPNKMNKKLAFLLGALVSEGSFHQGKIIFNNSDMNFYNNVKEAIYDLFKGVQLYERRITGNCLELDLYHTQIVDFLKNIGLKEEKSEKKEIPFSVLLSSKKVLSSFLQGLFEGDGSVQYKTDKRHDGKSIVLTYDSKSSTLIDQLKVVLLNFGIVTINPYKDKRNGCNKLQICGYQSIKQFKDKINFFSEKKRKILSSIDSINSSRMSKTDFIPYLNEYLRDKYKSQFIKKNNFDRYNNLKKNYKKLTKTIDSKDKKLIDFLLKQKYLFNKITGITKLSKKEEVYSVKVESKSHSFIANGFINHNTEARLSRMAEELLEDINKETVKFVPNYDNSKNEPSVLPSKLPNLLINGSSGIAVGMATNIPPHNLREVAEGTIKVIDNPDISLNELNQIIKGPDFPTGGVICGRHGIFNAYLKGKGKLLVRAKTSVEDVKGRKAIIVNEIPYQVNKSQMIEHIAELVKDKKVEGIYDLRDESDRTGMRIVIELKQDANEDIVLNQLFKHSRMQTTFGVNTLALVDNAPRILNLKEMISYFIKHRQKVVRKRTEFDLRKAEDRAHILEGLLIALESIDTIIASIKKSKSVLDAKEMLMEEYELSEKQSLAILDLRLQKLTSLEQEKIKTEHKELLKVIAGLKEILASEQKILDIIKEELLYLKQKYGDERRTDIVDMEEELEIEDLIEREDMVVTITRDGYIKRLPIDTYKQQRRGGKGILATATKEEDIVEDLFVANTLSYILFFTNKGRAHWLKVYVIPEASRQARGKAIVNMLNVDKDEKVTAYIPVESFEKGFIIMGTKKGTVKKTALENFSRPRKGGIIAINLEESDELINVVLTEGNQQILLATKNGMAVKFDEKNVRPTGRSSMGVRGIRLKDKDEVIGMVKSEDEGTLLTLTENGYGKRTKVSEYRLINRGGSGVKNIVCSERNGKVISIKSVTDDDEIFIISRKGVIIRTSAKGISVIGRNTQGVRLMRMGKDDKVVGAAKVLKEEESDDEEEFDKEIKEESNGETLEVVEGEE